MNTKPNLPSMAIIIIIIIIIVIIIMTLTGMDKLTNLTLLHFPNNILTDECIDVLTKSIANKKIEELNLSNNKVGWVLPTR